MATTADRLTRIVEAPFVWGAYCIMPRGRRPSLVGVIDHVAVAIRDVPDVTDAPVVARLDRGESRFRFANHVAGSHYREDIPSVIEYRILDGALWRPVYLPSSEGRPTAVQSDFEAFEEAWFASIGQRPGRAGMLQAYETPFRTEFDGPSLRRPGFFESAMTAEEFACREMVSSTRDDMIFEVGEAARNSFAMIGGVLHCRTPGPGYFTDHPLDEVVVTSACGEVPAAWRTTRDRVPRRLPGGGRSVGTQFRRSGSDARRDRDHRSGIVFHGRVG